METGGNPRLRFHPEVPDALYVESWTVGGRRLLFRSKDGGRTWTVAATGLPDSAFVHSLVVDPRDADLLHAVVSTARIVTPLMQVFRSRDGGLSWTRVSRGLQNVPQTSLGSFLHDPRNPDDLYLRTSDSGIYRLTVP